MTPALIIAKKRDGHALSAYEIEAFVGGYARGEVPDYQMSALAMAVYLRGMTFDETAALTETMLRSGAVLTWSDEVPVVDKHSTGGIGDKTSLILAPLLACCGLQVPMISGRGLGATGGTLDKLEAIPGFRTDLSLDELRRIVHEVGCAITGSTAELVPADRKLYALRDVTSTVASIPLITASIMSKKLAEGLDALVLDVKYGSGAFMKTRDEARQLAESLTAVGNRMGVRTTALLTDMNQPLGRMVGNAVEVDEAIEVLKGGGDGGGELAQMTRWLGFALLVDAGAAENGVVANQWFKAHLRSGRAYEKFVEMVRAQGGDLDAPRPRAPEHVVAADRTGYIAAIDAEKLGWAIIEMGGGRKVITDKIDHGVGLEIELAQIGFPVRAGDPLVRLFVRDAQRESAEALIRAAITIVDEPVERPPWFGGAVRGEREEG